ncbi:8402_t:CDS:2 [Dentiscutata erythropus]|uniref:8402_t:CDS:1 n=1 Tax=Dentiscutata erythropus TaxID=1348616 RepID=A0A9N9A674_9GLOM|nr:8402_t:CDS:2 [Dentiscutata erythropus]
MPCFADTIIRIKYVKNSASMNEESDSTSIWTIGKYPVGEENCEIELTLFLPNDEKERDLDTQVVFINNEFYSVGRKIVPGKYNNNIRPKMTVSSSTHLKILDKVPLSNKGNNEDAVFEILVGDYASREYKTFTFKVVYPHLKSRFKYVKNIIWPQESIIFVVGMMEVIEGNFYVYVTKVNNIDVATLNNSDDKTQMPSISAKSLRTKLLFTHQNIKNVNSVPNVKETSDVFVNKDSNEALLDDLFSPKHKRSKDTDEYDDLFETENVDSSAKMKDDFMEDNREKEIRSLSNIGEHQKKFKSQKKGKVHKTRSSNYKESHSFDVNNKDDK